MSTTRSKHSHRGISSWVILAIVFPAIMVSAAALAYYGYQYTEDVSLRMEDAFRENARADSERLVERVEARIDVVARSLLDSVVAKDGDSAKQACRIDPEPLMDSYAVVRFDEGTLVGLCKAGQNLEPWGFFGRHRTESGPYLKSLDFASVYQGNFRYLHQRFEREDVLIAYIGKQSEGGNRYFVAARIKTETVANIVNEEAANMKSRRRMVALDGRRRVVAGDVLVDPVVPKGHRFVFETLFGKALYAWDLQISPWDVAALHEQMRRQKVMGPLLISLSVSTIAVGLLIVWFGVLAERRAARLMSDFIANVSHELKTPLSLIRMFGEMIATGRHKGEQAAKEYGEIITRESDRLAHLIDNVLDFSRVERGKASYHFGPGDLAGVVDTALEVCRFRLENEGIQIHKDIAAELPPVRMDKDALTLLVLNLIDNAIKYAAEGKRIDVALRREPGGVVLVVRDFGPGIPEEDRRRIFERFFRADKARHTNVRGSGIGLSLVRHIAVAHGGRVVVQTPERSKDPGRGIAFCVYLPAPTTETPASNAG